MSRPRYDCQSWRSLPTLLYVWTGGPTYNNVGKTASRLRIVTQSRDNARIIGLSRQRQDSLQTVFRRQQVCPTMGTTVLWQCCDGVATESRIKKNSNFNVFFLLRQSYDGQDCVMTMLWLRPRRCCDCGTTASIGKHGGCWGSYKRDEPSK